MPELQQIHPSSYIGQALEDPRGSYFVNLDDVEAAICTPPCECIDCQHSFYAAGEQYRPSFWYRRRVTDGEARQIVEGHVSKAVQQRQHLLQLLETHGDIIVNRWKKKSREKRQVLLQEAVPEICEHRWIIPRYCWMPEHKQSGLGRRTWNRRCQLLLPWLSLEVLKTNPAVLFALLQNRTAYPPQDWATFDGRQLILSWALGHFDVDYSAKCVVMYGPNYGKVVDWQAGPAHRSDIIGFPKASLILEAQSYLLGGLSNVVDKILEGVDLSKPATSEKWKAMTKLGFRHANEVELWSPYTNQAFSIPPIFSIDNLISTIQTRLEAVGDHLWLLQTEPFYMKRYLKGFCQGEFYKTIKKDAAGALVTTELFNEVISYWRWYWIKNESENVKIVHNRFRDSIRQGTALPRAFDRALGALELLVVNEVIYRAGQIGKTVPQRPGFSHNWNFEWRPDESPTAFSLKRKIGAGVEQKDIFENDPLEFCLSQLQAKPDIQTNYDHAIMFAFLESHLANSNSKERARIDEILYQKLSDLASCHDILVSIRLHRPQNIARVIEEVVDSEDRIAWKGQKIRGYLTNDDHIVLGTALLRDFYNTPPPTGQKDLSWINKSRTIRKALEAFWTGIRKTPKLVLESSGFSPDEVNRCMEVISSNLNPEYIASVNVEEEEILATIQRTQTPSLVHLQTEWGSGKLTKPSSPSTKKKNKTRPAEPDRDIEKIDDEVAGIKLNSEPTKDPTLKVQVKQRAFDMLSLMFPANANESARSLEWAMFVHAMSDLRFTARNGGGSAVIFERENSAMGADAIGGKIIFHKPHPNPSIDSIMLHSMGKRMAKWFGWHKELFALEV